MPQASINYPTAIVNANSQNGEPNGGYHPQGKRAYRAAVMRIKECLMVYKEPRLYHICFQGGTNTDHKEVLAATVRTLERASVPCEWFSAREIDSAKGEHLHVFLLVDSKNKNVNGILNRVNGGFLKVECERRGLLPPHINPPKNNIFLQWSRRIPGMLKRPWYAQLPYLGPGNKLTKLGKDRLENALVWLTYIYKARGKPDMTTQIGTRTQIFSSSRPNRKRHTSECGLMPSESALMDAVEYDEDEDEDEIAPELIAAGHKAQLCGRANFQLKRNEPY